jgi:hypothetical protein
MRRYLLLIGLVLAACADQPKDPKVAADAASRVEDADTPEHRLALAKKLHLKVVNKNGEEVYCRIDPVTASRIETQTRCYTAQQLADLQRQTDQDINYLWRPNQGPTPTLGH